MAKLTGQEIVELVSQTTKKGLNWGVEYGKGDNVRIVFRKPGNSPSGRFEEQPLPFPPDPEEGFDGDAKPR